MARLLDWQIPTAAENGMISPYNPDRVNPASYDLALADIIFVEREQSEFIRSCLRWHELDLSKYCNDITPREWREEIARVTELDVSSCKNMDSVYLLEPGQFILASVAERLKLPRNIEAEFCLKSTSARSGLQQLMANYADPGYEGNLTLELLNVSSSYVPIWPGMLIGQYKFNSLDAMPLQDYSQTGHYQGDEKARASRFYKESET